MVVRPHGKAPVNPPAVLEINFLYLQDIGPFWSPFWPDSLQIR